MISFPCFGQYTSSSYAYCIPAEDNSDRRTVRQFKKRKSTKSKKSILMDLVFTEDKEEWNEGTKLAVPLRCLSQCDTYYDLHSQYPSEKYIKKYFKRLGISLDSELIERPYDFGYYSAVKFDQSKKKEVIKYGAKCGHCNTFIRIRNQSAEGGFLSYIAYFRHWINYHYDEL